jgi:hypothetical protein
VPGGLDAAGAATVHELQRPEPVDDGFPPLRQLGRGMALHPPQNRAEKWFSGGLVAQSGDLALVSHESDESESRAFANRTGKCKRLRRGEHRRPPGADVS